MTREERFRDAAEAFVDATIGALGFDKQPEPVNDDEQVLLVEAAQRRPNHARMIRYDAWGRVLEIFEWRIRPSDHDEFARMRNTGKRIYWRHE